MSRADIRQMSIDGLAAGSTHGTWRFLVDHRWMLPTMRTEDTFGLQKINAGLRVDANVRAAIAYSANSSSKDDFFFHEVDTLARGASHMRLFTDLAQAMGWLAD